MNIPFKIGDSFNSLKKWVFYNTPTFLMNGRQVIIKDGKHEVIFRGDDTITKIVTILRLINPIRKWDKHNW